MRGALRAILLFGLGAIASALALQSMGCRRLCTLNCERDICAMRDRRIGDVRSLGFLTGFWNQ
jgi:hypothetical protein